MPLAKTDLILLCPGCGKHIRRGVQPEHLEAEYVCDSCGTPVPADLAAVDFVAAYPLRNVWGARG